MIGRVLLLAAALGCGTTVAHIGLASVGFRVGPGTPAADRAAHPAAPADVARPRPFVEFLLGADVVVLGRFRGGAADTRGISIAVESVLLGALRDRRVTLASSAGYWNRTLKPGNRVLMWGLRSRSGLFRGNLATIGALGALRFQPGFHAPEEDMTLRYRKLGALGRLRTQLRQVAPRHHVNAFDGADAAVLVRVAAVRSGNACEIQPIAVVAGRAVHTPMDMHWQSPGPYCSFHPRVGDTLVVPIRRGARVDSVALPPCPSGLVVRDGFSPGFGAVDVTHPPAVLRTVAGRVRLVPIARR